MTTQHTVREHRESEIALGTSIERRGLRTVLAAGHSWFSES